MTRIVLRSMGTLAVACILLPVMAAGQGLTGMLIGTVTDGSGGVLPGATVRVSSTALIGGAAMRPTNEKGQFRFAALPPGSYVLDVELQGFAPYRVVAIRLGSGATIDVSVVLKVAGVEASVDVDGAAPRIDARHPGFLTRFGPEDLRAIPTRRASFLDGLRNVPGVSPTSPSSGTVTTISAFGSGTNENMFLIDGTNTTCPCNGVARSETGVDFIQEIQVQAVGASAEFGNVQGAVVNIITRQGSNRLLSDASFYRQPARLTSQPVRLAYDQNRRESGYERTRYRDFTSNIGGPAVRERVWFFGGYQYLRDYDSQPGTDPSLPRTYEQNKGFAKLTWRLAPGWQLVQSFHEEVWANPDQPKVDRPFSTTTRTHASVPAMTFGQLTHTASNTVWDLRAGRFVYLQQMPPSNGDRSTPSRQDSPANIFSGGPQSFGALTLFRTTAKATVTSYRPGLWGADHEWKIGGQFERGEHHSPNVIPTGARYVYRNGQPSQATFSDPSNTGGVFLTAGAFATDAITLRNRVTINAGLRFDHSRAISQDLFAVDSTGRETSTAIPGAGTLFVWNIVSPRMGVTARLDAAGRTILRASYGRFSQGVLTGEIAAFHPGATSVTVKDFVAADGDYTRIRSVLDHTNLQLDPDIRAPRTDEYSVGVDREVGRRLALAIAYVRKSGANFIGWTDVGGQYRTATRPLADGQSVTVYELQNSYADQRFLLTNPDAYSMTYNGLVMAVEKRRSNGWQAFGSYTLSRATGLQSAGGASASGAQVSTVAPPPGPGGLTYGRDPNDLTNARGRLPNDRPHMFRTMVSVDVPRTGFVLAANLQAFSGKPWAATAQVNLPQNPTQRVQIEPRGTRRLSSQTLLDLRLSRPIPVGRAGRVDLLLDVLNVLNDAAEEGLVTDTLVTESTVRNATFGQPNVFMDPRRVMLGIRLNLGR